MDNAFYIRRIRWQLPFLTTFWGVAFLLLLAGLLSCRVANTQSPKPTAQKTVAFQVDKLGNVYLINEASQILKLDNNGDSVGTTNEGVSNGRLTWLDVSNPLRPLLWYQSFNHVLLLDRFLKTTHQLKLAQAGFPQCSAVATSVDNHLWIYDALDNKLKKIDVNGNLLLESPDLRILVQEAPTPVFILEKDKQVVLADTSRGFYLFDSYGTYKKMIPFVGFSQFQLTENGLLVLANREAIQIAYDGINEKRFKLPAQVLPAASAFYQAGKWYYLNPDGTVGVAAATLAN